MIKVYEDFYEAGCTMDGEKNRVMLKKNDETLISMTFLGEKVKLTVYENNEEVHSKTVNLHEIRGISTYGKLPMPAVIYY